MKTYVMLHLTAIPFTSLQVDKTTTFNLWTSSQFQLPPPPDLCGVSESAPRWADLPTDRSEEIASSAGSSARKTKQAIEDRALKTEHCIMSMVVGERRGAKSGIQRGEKRRVEEPKSAEDQKKNRERTEA